MEHPPPAAPQARRWRRGKPAPGRQRRPLDDRGAVAAAVGDRRRPAKGKDEERFPPTWFPRVSGPRDVDGEGIAPFQKKVPRDRPQSGVVKTEDSKRSRPFSGARAARWRRQDLRRRARAAPGRRYRLNSRGHRRRRRRRRRHLRRRRRWSRRALGLGAAARRRAREHLSPNPLPPSNPEAPPPAAALPPGRQSANRRPKARYRCRI